MNDFMRFPSSLEAFLAAEKGTFDSKFVTSGTLKA
jgi:hypothetical protein